jgi:hypothetical protein
MLCIITVIIDFKRIIINNFGTNFSKTSGQNSWISDLHEIALTIHSVNNITIFYS